MITKSGYQYRLLHDVDNGFDAGITVMALHPVSAQDKIECEIPEDWSGWWFSIRHQPEPRSDTGLCLPDWEFENYLEPLTELNDAYDLYMRQVN